MLNCLPQLPCCSHSVPGGWKLSSWETLECFYFLFCLPAFDSLQFTVQQQLRNLPAVTHSPQIHSLGGLCWEEQQHFCAGRLAEFQPSFWIIPSCRLVESVALLVWVSELRRAVLMKAQIVMLGKVQRRRGPWLSSDHHTIHCYWGFNGKPQGSG